MSLFTGAAVLGAALAAGTASTVSAQKSSSAAKDAADQQAAATTKAAELKKQSDDAALEFSKQQSENDYRNQELTRRANYDQFAAQRARLGTVGNLLGLPAPEIPAYVASQDPNFTGGGAPSQSGAAPATPPATAGSDPVTQAIADNYKALGVTPTGPGTGPTDIAYMVQQAKASLASGERPLSYWLGPQGRIAQELAKAKGGGGTLAQAAAPPPQGTLAMMAAGPYQVANPTAALKIQPYQGTISRLGA